MSVARVAAALTAVPVVERLAAVAARLSLLRSRWRRLGSRVWVWVAFLVWVWAAAFLG
ncbi:Uncharacterised protein [Mycolicibacterium vanbaalenii]|uniref:Uncharacterized protein n=1 Tax=Mycolicibacterium vanbaalenii TaxID=110539 RepID=A0A5S9P8F1_MYCVN|nr:Uncharacterised protein [Mycolicibacterium vanbaalenii]